MKLIVMTIFFLETDFLQFSKDLQYSMSYVWLLTFNKTQKKSKNLYNSDLKSI
jgi:hypothetical protein